MPKPLIAFTCGDPGGIGPRVVLKTIVDPKIRALLNPLLVGEEIVWKKAGWRPQMAPVLSPNTHAKNPPSGRASALGGEISFSAFRLAVHLADRKLISALVTAPISKEGWKMAGVPYRDHTEYLEEKVPDARNVQMVLGLPSYRLWCVLVTRHVALEAVPKILDAEKILQAAQALNETLMRMGYRKPRLGLCALNPHGGEKGAFGKQEMTILSKAILLAQSRDIRLLGPIAADSAWYLHRKGDVDGLVCLYHDQALIALKAAAGLSSVNWTTGLPFIRVSPAHGTAFDRASSRTIDPSATMAAAELAAKLCRVKSEK